METLNHLENQYFLDSVGVDHEYTASNPGIKDQIWEKMKTLVRCKQKILEIRTQLDEKNRVLPTEFQPSRILKLRLEIKFLSANLSAIIKIAAKTANELRLNVPQYLKNEYELYVSFCNEN